MLSVCMLTGGAMYLGYKAYRDGELVPLRIEWLDRLKHFFTAQPAVPGQKVGAANEPTWPAQTGLRLDKVAVDDALPPKADVNSELMLASVTLGLATTSAFIYPPAQIICLPLLLYLGIEPVQSVYRAWREEGQVTLVMAETSILVFCVVQRYYLVGALSCEVHALGRRLWQAHQARITPLQVTWQPPTWAWLQQAGKECATPVQDLREGDIIIVHTGEMVPVAGVITAGVAWVKRKYEPMTTLVTSQASGQADSKVTIGHNVEAATIVQLGRICVLVITVDNRPVKQQ